MITALADSFLVGASPVGVSPHAVSDNAAIQSSALVIMGVWFLV
jgi:hypothetical protein